MNVARAILTVVIISNIVSLSTPSLGKGTHADNLSSLMIADTKHAIKSGKSIDELIDKRECIWLPILRYQRNMFCSQSKIAAIIEDKPDAIKLKLNIIPVYVVEEGCVYHSKGINKAWEACVSTDVKAIMGIISELDKLSANKVSHCVFHAKDASNDLSYQLRYHTIYMCLKKFL